MYSSDSFFFFFLWQLLAVGKQLNGPLLPPAGKKCIAEFWHLHKIKKKKNLNENNNLLNHSKHVSTPKKLQYK